MNNKQFSNVLEQQLMRDIGVASVACPTCQRLYADPDEIDFINKFKECGYCSTRANYETNAE